MFLSERFDKLGFDDLSKQVRLGIFGGTFDPIHTGHLAAAEAARQQLGLDAVVFMPANIPVFKRDINVSSAEQRMEMCRIAVAGNPFFDASDFEIKRGGDTYTVDTLTQLREYYPDNVSLYFITGVDAMLAIDKWRRAADMAHLATFVTMLRPGYELAEADVQRIRDNCGIEVNYVEAPGLDIASSALRKMVGQGKSIRYLLPDNVCQYIETNGLYKTV